MIVAQGTQFHSSETLLDRSKCLKSKLREIFIQFIQEKTVVVNFGKTLAPFACSAFISCVPSEHHKSCTSTCYFTFKHANIFWLSFLLL